MRYRRRYHTYTRIAPPVTPPRALSHPLKRNVNPDVRHGQVMTMRLWPTNYWWELFVLDNGCIDTLETALQAVCDTSCDGFYALFIINIRLAGG